MTETGTKTKADYYQITLSVFLKSPVPEDILKAYFEDPDGKGYRVLSVFVVNNMNDTFIDWSTALGIIDAADAIFNEAVSNGNIQLTA